MIGLKWVYRKVVRIDDSPGRIALGAGIGVFSGILPGTGPLAAIFLAVILRANRAAALAAGVLTNTWLSILTFVLASQVGAAIFGIGRQELQEEWQLLFSSWDWQRVVWSPIVKVALPVMAGYVLIGALFGVAAYMVTWGVVVVYRRVRLQRIQP